MSTHNTIACLRVKLGYTKEMGVCHGISLLWLEACFLKEEDKFHQRIKKIVSENENIIELSNKLKKGINLTEKEKELFEILGFFDSLNLYQSPKNHSFLFNVMSAQNQSDIEFNSRFASSDKIRDLGGLVTVYSQPNIFTKNELKQYLQNLALVFDGVADKSPQTFGAVISNHNHTLSLTYTPGKGWRFIDINQYDDFKSTSLVERIAKGFYNKEYIAINVSVVTTKKNASLLKLEEGLTKFKESHVMTEEIASRETEEGIGLAFIAAKCGHAHVIATLAKHNKASLDKANKNGALPAYIAAYHGHFQVIAELAKYGANLNRADNNGRTPTYAAAQNGHFQVIATLAEYDADLNKATNDGHTPVHIAAQNGHAHVVATLAKHKASLDKRNKNGATPVHIAAQNGHAHVIAILAEHKANLSQENNDGATPAYMAAQNGHTHVIVELAKNKADLNKGNKNGWPPAHIAAHHGHVLVIAALAEHKADLNTADNYGNTPAHIAAYRGDVHVITKLAKHKVDFNKKNKVGLTPAFLAALEGKVAVVSELLSCGADFNLALNYSAEQLRAFAKNDKEKAVKMEQFIKKQISLGQTLITMSPYNVAELMGHEDVLQFLSKQAMKNNLLCVKRSFIEMNDGQKEIEGLENKDKKSFKKGKHSNTPLQIFSIFPESKNNEEVEFSNVLNVVTKTDNN